MASEVALGIEKKCTNSDYADTFLDGLRKMRVRQKLCDFSLYVQGEIIYVHKVALALASDYFASMFETDMKEGREGVIKVEDVDIATIKTLVEYMYSGIITLTEENVENLLSIADLYQILWVKEQCAQFLKSIVNQKNCFRIRKFADMRYCEELFDFSHKYILDNFHDLTDAEDWLLLPFEEIQNLIKDEQRKNSVRFVESAYKASINWIKHDLEERKVHLRELMSHIHLPCVSTKFLRNHVVGEPMVIEDQKCSKSLIEALSERCSTETKREEERKEEKGSNEMVFLFLVGGCASRFGTSPLNYMRVYDVSKNKASPPIVAVGPSALNYVRVYDVSKNKEVPLPTMAQARYENSAISLNGVIYSIGGLSNGMELSTAECYYPFNKRWNHIASMTVGRSNFGICAYHQELYVVGGNSTRVVEKYNPARDQWGRCPPVPGNTTPCTRAALAQNSIYSFTGYSWFRFDPREGGWHALNVATNWQRDKFELLSNDRSLFWIGSTCLRFDVQMNKWDLMEPPPLWQGDNFTAMRAADNIYLLDGKVKRYSIPNNKWATVNAMSFAYNGGAGAVLTGSFDFN